MEHLLEHGGMCSYGETYRTYHRESQTLFTDELQRRLTIPTLMPSPRATIADLIYGMMDGNETDMVSLSKRMQDCANIDNVIMGKTLYSDSWLEV